MTCISNAEVTRYPSYQPFRLNGVESEDHLHEQIDPVLSLLRCGEGLSSADLCPWHDDRMWATKSS